jgi:hypothetical protein
MVADTLALYREAAARDGAASHPQTRTP